MIITTEKVVRFLRNEINSLEDLKKKLIKLKDNKNVGIIAISISSDEDEDIEIYSNNLLIEKEVGNEVIIAFENSATIEFIYTKGEWDYYYNRLDPDVPPEYKILEERREEVYYKIEKNKIKKYGQEVEIFDKQEEFEYAISVIDEELPKLKKQLKEELKELNNN